MARKNNSQNQFSRFLGFAVGLAKNMAHSPEGVSRQDLIANVYEALGGILKCQVKLDTTMNITNGSVCNPLGLTITSQVGSTGNYGILLSGLPTWLSHLAPANFNLQFQIITDTGECPYILTGDIAVSGDVIGLDFYIFDVDGTTPKDLDASSRICVDLTTVL